MARRWKVFLIVGLLTLAADQASKVWARHTLPTVTAHDGRTYGRTVEVIPNFWDWRLSFNPGASFGIFSGTKNARVFLSVIGVIALGAVAWMLRSARDDQRRLIWGLGLVFGGAVGNLYDRILYGEVTDFIVWRYHDKEWPTFNIADVALVIGVGLLFLDMSREAKASRKSAKDLSAGKKSGT